MCSSDLARNVACTGGRPLAITNCLNFGNPERGETPYMFTEAIEGMAEACEALQAPDVKQKLTTMAQIVVGNSPAEAMALLKPEHEQFGRLIRERNLKFDQ